MQPFRKSFSVGVAANSALAVTGNNLFRYKNMNGKSKEQQNCEIEP